MGIQESGLKILTNLDDLYSSELLKGLRNHYILSPVYQTFVKNSYTTYDIIKIQNIDNKIITGKSIGTVLINSSKKNIKYDSFSPKKLDTYYNLSLYDIANKDNHIFLILNEIMDYNLIT